MGGEITLVEHLKKIASSGGSARWKGVSDKERTKILTKASRARKKKKKV